MKTRYILSAALALTLIATSNTTAQRRRTTSPPTPAKLEDLPRRAVDTVATADPETMVIIFSNNTWEYYRPDMASKFDDLPIYRQHWDTTQVFAYRSIELSDLPQTIELKLINDDLSEFHYPLLGRVISPYGPRRRRNHNGIDIPLRTGEPIYAAFDGKVRYAKYNSGGFGNLVIVRHTNGLETWSAHLTRCNVKPNDYVKAGQIIGYGGSTGRSTGPHLHFEVRYCDQTFDPQFLFDFPNGLLKYQTFVLDRSYFNIHSRASDQLEEDDDDFDPSTILLASQNEGETILERVEKAEKAAEEAAAAPPKPKQSVSSQNKVYHTVRSGDSLSKIAVRYGTTITKICELNGISRNAKIRIGQKLRVK